MSVTKYLDRHAEPEAALFAEFDRHYDRILCIPAFAEPDTLLDTLHADPGVDALLLILVVNAFAAATPAQHALNRDLLHTLHTRYPPLAAVANNIHLLQLDDRRDLLLVERCSAGLLLDKKAGVGQARKIACDIACRLIHQGNIASPWIHSTDADATLPSDYFAAVDELDTKHTAAAVYPFTHTPNPDPAIAHAQVLYDTSLNYYVAGLTWAGSPWAFHTIGSCLAINARHYAEARGFPRRNAAEDFYLLNKLAKNGRIDTLATSPIRLASRPSNRVPFGTGPALSKIMAMADPEREFLFYHPCCFTYLKAWHAMADTLWENGELALDPDIITAFLAARDDLRDVAPDILMACLAELDPPAALTHALTHSRTQAVFDRHMRNWFDAFRTLKFIHSLRDHHLPSIPLDKARELAPNLFDARDGCSV